MCARLPRFASSSATVYVRIERNQPAGTWTAYFKFNSGDDWIRNPSNSYDALLINGTLSSPGNVKIALLARTWSGTYRCMGYFKYIRVTPLVSCLATGSTRYTSAAVACNQGAGNPCVSSMVGFSYSTPYQVQVAAGNGGTGGGYSAPRLANAPFTAPSSTAGGLDFSNVAASVSAGSLVEVAAGKSAVMPTTWANYAPGFGAQVVFDGVLNTYAQAGNPLQANGDWWAVDLGRMMAVKSIYIVNRQDCCQARSAHLEWYVGNNPPPQWNHNPQCPVANWPTAAAALLSSAPGAFSPAFNASLPYSAFFPCELWGRYVFLHAPQSLGQLNAADGQFNLAEIRVYASNTCGPRVSVGGTTATPVTCAGPARNGDVCAQSCPPGTVATAGSPISTCDGDVWDEATLVCSPVCPPANLPPLADSCTQTLFTEQFALGDEVGATSRWISLGGDGQAFGTSWFVNDGELVAATTLGCSDMMHAVYSSDKVRGRIGEGMCEVMGKQQPWG